jgi:hypothetical protein
MDKHLDARFFKYLGFYTKKEGMEFVESIPVLRKEIAKFQRDVEKDIAIHADALKTVFYAHDTEMRKFINTFKLQRKEQALDRKGIKDEEVKDDTRTQLKQELLLELQREQNEIALRMNKDLFPVYEALPDFTELFMKLIRMHYSLSPEERHRLLTLKMDVESAYRTLASTAMELNVMAKNKQI